MNPPRALTAQQRRLWWLASLALVGCAPLRPSPPPPSPGHLSASPLIADPIPAIVPPVSFVPPPHATARGDRYTVVVNEVSVRELLFALARDAALNLDVPGDLEGQVTLNAIDQTVPQILERIARQVNLRYFIKGDTLSVSRDDPYFHTYEVGYVNLARDTETTVNIATQVATTGEGGAAQSGGNARGGGAQGANSSATRVNSRASNRFWETLTSNVLGIIGEAGLAPGDPLASAALVVNPEAGLLSVKASGRQHELIADFIDRVLTNAHRQVLIEATVVEVSLNNQYQAGVDWRLVLAQTAAGVGFNQSLIGAAASGVIEGAVSSFTFGYRNPAANGQLVEATVQLLSEFGDTKVLSSPRLMVLNNQTALLKVVEELVYFSVAVTNTDATQNGQGRTFVQSEIHSVPVGLVMAVTPQISANQEVTLTVRPTISQKVGDAIDPGPQLASRLNGGGDADITNLVPIIRTREMESVLKLVNGQVGMLGGLMQDERRNANREVPGLARLPLVGPLLFHSEEMRNKKTELVIFLRPVVVTEPSLDKDLRDYRQFVGTADAASL